MNFARTFLKGMVMFLIICEFSYEILYESSIHLFFKSKENMGELRDAASASCWGSAAMETKKDLDLSVLMFHYLLC